MLHLNLAYEASNRTNILTKHIETTHDIDLKRDSTKYGCSKHKAADQVCRWILSISKGNSYAHTWSQATGIQKWSQLSHKEGMEAGKNAIIRSVNHGECSSLRLELWRLNGRLEEGNHLTQIAGYTSNTRGRGKSIHSWTSHEKSRIKGTIEEWSWAMNATNNWRLQDARVCKVLWIKQWNID